MCLLKCKTFRCGHPGFFEIIAQCAFGCTPTGADGFNAGLYPSHTCTGSVTAVVKIIKVRRPFYCPVCHHSIMDQMRDFQHPIIWSLENGFQSLAYTKPPKGSPYVEQWNARVKALVKMDGEKAMGELDFLIWFSPWHRFQWNKRNRLDVDPVKRCVEKWMAPYNWNADDERALLLWRMNKFAKKQGPIGGYGRYSEAEMLKRGHDWPSYGYP